MEPIELEKRIEQLQSEKQLLVATAELRAAWYDGQIYALQQLAQERAPAEVEKGEGRATRDDP